MLDERYDEANRYFTEIIRLEPDSPVGYTQLAKSYSLSQRYD
jgi:tetratricopeptide (TPR) repeat protein